MYENIKSYLMIMEMQLNSEIVATIFATLGEALVEGFYDINWESSQGLLVNLVSYNFY